MSYWNKSTKDHCRVDHAYIISADLAQTHDYTAISVIERLRYWYDPDNPFRTEFYEHELPTDYHLKSLVRPDRGTKYPDIIKRLREIYDSPQLREYPKTCVIDMTGVGRPVYDQMQESGFRRQVYGILITGGNSMSREGQVFSVPKKDLITSLQIAFQNGEFKMAKGVPLANEMMNELNSFKYKMTPSANMQFEAWREADHDDMVLSCAMGVWIGAQRWTRFYNQTRLY